MPGKERSMLLDRDCCRNGAMRRQRIRGGRSSADERPSQPVPDHCAVGRSSRGEDMGSAERGRDRQRWRIRLGGESVRRESRYSSRRIPVRVRQLRRFRRGAGHEVRFIRQTPEEFRRRHVHFSAQDLRGCGRQRLGGRRAEARTSGSARRTRTKSRRATSWSSSARRARCC